MTDSPETYVKILFRYYSDVLDEETVETMWATIVDKDKGLYKIDNIPFYGPSVASDDIILAQYDESELMLTYRETVKHSGNSIVQVIIMGDKTDINQIRNIFEVMGCHSEKVNDKYFSMEIPASIDYGLLKLKLVQLENDNIIGYAEPCLSPNHRAQSDGSR
jgi:hypothetical protein